MKQVNKSIVLSKYTRSPDPSILNRIREFLKNFAILETQSGVPLLVHFDQRSQAFYIICHLEPKTLASKSDLEAVLDPQESEDYKLNRGLYIDSYAYKIMESDGLRGRSFEDLVVEYDTSYRPDRPLKVFGGQHRIQAIKEAVKKDVLVPHGARVYFNLSIEQRFDIAAANNTSIAVSDDLLDRMNEDMLGPHLRSWSQTVGFLSEGQNFADKRSSLGIPTVRIARTLVVNFYRGMAAGEDDFHLPVVCSSGPRVDEHYKEVRESANWSDNRLITMGKQFAMLHTVQRERVLNRTKDRYLEFANKAIHPCVAASWAYAAGLFQRNPTFLDAHYALAHSTSSPDDPLNARALLSARLKGVDPDTYRGLGSRISSDELGRMLYVFRLQATKAARRGINLKLANAAIQGYEADKLQLRAKKALENI